MKKAIFICIVFAGLSFTGYSQQVQKGNKSDFHVPPPHPVHPPHPGNGNGNGGNDNGNGNGGGNDDKDKSVKAPESSQSTKGNVKWPDTPPAPTTGKKNGK